MASKSKSKNKPQKKRNAYMVGLIVAIGLAVLSLVEYYIAILPELYPGTPQSPTALFLIAFIKAALVVYFFMHVYRLWRPDDHADDHVDGHAGNHVGNQGGH